MTFWPDGATWPSVVLKAGYSESWPDLVAVVGGLRQSGQCDNLGKNIFNRHGWAGKSED